jgi:molybdopterin-binding protein
MCDRLEFAVLVTLSCHVYNDSGSTQPGVVFSPFSALRYGCMVLAGERNVKFGARNPLAGMVESVSKGAVNCEVGIKLKGGTLVYAVVTNKAVLELGLKPGVPASALIKVSHVVLGVPA